MQIPVHRGVGVEALKGRFTRRAGLGSVAGLLATALAGSGCLLNQPAGARLLVSRDGALWAVPLDGSAPRRLTQPERGAFDQDPAPSPDGKALVFTRTPPPPRIDPTRPFTPAALPQAALYLAGPDGKSPRRLAALPPQAYGGRLENAIWHPDGRALYATATTWSYENSVITGQHIDVVRVALADGNLVPVVPDAAMPAVSPDGRFLAYVRTSEQGAGLFLAELSADGTGISRERAVLPPGRLEAIAWPCFSPDGRWIALSAAARPVSAMSDVLPPTAAAAPAPASGGIQQVADTARRALAGVMELLGRLSHTPAVYAHGLPMDVFVVGRDGGDVRRLTTLLEDDPSLAWSPDGTSLAVAAAGGLYIVSAGGGQPRLLDRAGAFGGIAWVAR